MTTAERLLKVNEYVDKAESLNKELGQTLYGSNEKSTLDTNVHQAISDFNSVKDKFVENGVEVSDDTKTSEYADKVDEVYSVGKSDGYTEGQEAGYTKGKTDGHAEGVEYGYNSGYAEGASAGYAEGIDVGKAEGFTAGKTEGLNEGYNNGFVDGKAEGSEEGFNSGFIEGKAEGVEEGKKAEYDAFWDAYQENGKRTNYGGCFAGVAWNKNTFKPKYNIRPINAQQMFWNNWVGGDLVEVLSSLDITLDFSGCTSIATCFGWCGITRVGEMDLRKTYNASAIFSGAYNIETIDKIVVNKNTTFTSWFSQVTTLKNITFEGVIAQNGLNLQWSPNLTYETLRSIINCLQDKSADTSGTSWVVTVGTANIAKLTADDLLEITTKGWLFK